jgi:Nif11 domain
VITAPFSRRWAGFSRVSLVSRGPSIAVDVAEQDLKAFLDALAHDTALQEKLNDTKDLDAALAVAKEAGFEISKAD